MSKIPSTIYQDLKNNKSFLNTILTNLAKDSRKQIQEYTIDEILKEAKFLKEQMTSGGNWYETFSYYYGNEEDIPDYDLEEYTSLKIEYKDLCKFIDKWSIKKKENDIQTKKDILKTLEKGTKINTDKYGVIEFVKCNRTRFLAVWKGEEWLFKISSFQGIETK